MQQCRLAVCIFAAVMAIPTAVRAEQPKGATETILKRWFDLQAAVAAARYRDVDTSGGTCTARQMIVREQVKARAKFDAKGRYALNFNIATGGSFISGWNTSGVGTGPAVARLYLKHLFVSAAPVKGVEFQYGGIGVSKGDSTEVTSYDDDGYLAGARASIRRPKQFFFDEVSLTQAYLGDTKTPSVFDRYERLADSNYYQVLALKNVGKILTVSADYTRLDGVGTVRAAFTYRHALGVADSLHFDQYTRTGDTGAFGYSVYGEKLLGKRGTFGVGWASIDANYGGLNGDRFQKGRRVFSNAAVNLLPELVLGAYYGKALANDYPVANGTRFDVILTYNVLKTLQKAHLF